MVNPGSATGEYDIKLSIHYDYAEDEAEGRAENQRWIGTVEINRARTFNWSKRGESQAAGVDNS